MRSKLKVHPEIIQSDWYQAMALRPQPLDPRATVTVEARDQDDNPITISVVNERALTLFLNHHEVITQMTIGLFPELLALGYLCNQHLLSDVSQVTAIDYDPEIDVIVVRTQDDQWRPLTHRTQTSGCAQGTMFGNLIESIETTRLPAGRRISLTEITLLLQRVQMMPTVYLKAGAIHGCTLARGAVPLLSVEDIGRHNAVDTIAGYIYQHQWPTEDKVMVTTGRLTSEMVLKTIQLKIPILISRSGYTAPAIELARRCDLTLIGRAKGKRLQVLASPQRLRF